MQAFVECNIMTQITQSNLLLEHTNIENLLYEPPSTLFRYFSSREARDNFLAGWIWFAGPNQNRFFAEEYGGINDQYEYRTDFGTYIGEYALPFSDELLDPSKYNIEVFNVPGLIEHIIESIKSGKGHKISWLNYAELQNYRRILPQVILAKNTNTSLDAKLYITGVGGRKLTYETKKQVKGTSYNGIEVARKARNGNNVVEDEGEYRVYIQSGDFLSDHNINGVKHLQIKCPNINSFCRIIE